MQTTIAPTAPSPIPSWVPERHRPYLSGRMVEIPNLPLPVKRRMRTSKKISVSDWARQYRIVTDGAHEGPWRHEYAPHTVQIMDTFGLSYVREVWFCGVEQSGKTNTMLNCLGWCVDCSPGNIFYLMPTEETAARMVGGKIKPMLARSNRLKKYLSAWQNDSTLSLLRLTHGMMVFPAHANSASDMATWAAKHCFGDEVDKYPVMVKKEADPITLIKKRNRTYRGRYKRFFASTPAGRFIQAGMNGCQQVWEMVVQCPECGEMIRMDADHLVFPNGATADDLAPSVVGYACNECGALWDDIKRELAIRGGRWRTRKGGDVTRPETVGFHHRAWECLDISLHEIGAAWLKAQAGGLNEKTAWANGYEAVNYEDVVEPVVTEEGLLRYRSELPKNMVPPETARLVLLVDTQQDSFYYQVWAFGFAPGIAMHMVRHGECRWFADLEALLARNWEDAAGKRYRISAGMIDSGGTRRSWQKHSRTMEVYEWCSRNAGMTPLKGMHGRSGEMVSWKVVDTFPGSNKIIPGGLSRANLRVDLFKDMMARMLAIEPDEAGALAFHAGIDSAFARHYLSEALNEKGEWEHNRSKGRNDYFDCTNYAVALREILRGTIELETMAGQRRGTGPTENEKVRAENNNQRVRW